MTSEALGKEIRRQIEEKGEALILWRETDEAFDHIKFNRSKYIQIWAAQRNWSMETNSSEHSYLFKQVYMVD